MGTETTDQFSLSRHYQIYLVTPLARRNMCNNPSFELGTVNWTTTSGSLTATTTRQRFGAYAAALQPGGMRTAVYGNTVPLVFAANTVYAISIYFLGVEQGRYTLSVANTSNVPLATREVRGAAGWKRAILIYRETATANRRVLFSHANAVAAASELYLDGLQVEACEDGVLEATTYIDGDQPGVLPYETPPPYVWEGVPHNSSSQRSAQTRAGGRLVDLKSLGFSLVAVTGLGMAPVQNLTDTYTLTDGSWYQTSRYNARSFTLTGVVEGMPTTRQQRMARLQQYLQPGLGGVRQPLKLVVMPTDHCSEPVGDPGEIVCSYVGGLEGNTQSPYTEQVNLQFEQHQPFITSRGQGATLNVQSTNTSPAGVIHLQASGTVDTLDNTPTSSSLLGQAGVYHAIVDSDGTLIAVGDFTQLPDTTVMRLISRWNPATRAWTSVGSATHFPGGGAVLYVARLGADGLLYVGGQFADAGGDPNQDNIARWNGSVWQPLGTGTNGTVRDLDTDSRYLYVVGEFTVAGGISTNRFARWEYATSTWSTLGSPTFNNAIYAVCVDRNGRDIYVGGLFTTPTNRIARWNGSSWVAMGTGAGTGAVYDITQGSDGRIYVVGTFTSMGGVANTNSIAVWDGTQWLPLYNSDTPLTASATAVVETPNREIATIHGGNVWTGANTPNNISLWKGGWVPVVHGSRFFTAGLPLQGLINDRQGGFYVVRPNATTDAFYPAGITTVHNKGNAPTALKITIRAPASGVGLDTRLFAVVNLTNQKALYFRGISVSNNEVITIDTSGPRPTVASNTRGNLALASILRPGSTLSSDFLSPGNNRILMHWSVVNQTTPPTVTAEWLTAHLSVEALTWSSTS